MQPTPIHTAMEAPLQPHTPAPTGKKAALVLSTGGARGIAHIGAIEEILRQGFQITSIAGSSMGALVGAAYATGRLDACKDFLCTLNLRRILGLMDFTLTRPGLIKGDRIMRKMLDIIPDVNIEDLPLPYTAIATNLDGDREYRFTRGSLHRAIRASIAVPFIFTPVYHEGITLIDGGITNPLPLSAVQRTEGDTLIGVIACSTKTDKPAGTPIVRRGKKDILVEALTSVIQRLISHSAEAYRPDLLIRIPTRSYGFLQFNRARALIDEGTRAAAAACEAYHNPAGQPALNPDTAL